MEEHKDGDVLYGGINNVNTGPTDGGSMIPVIEKQIKRVAIKPAESIKQDLTTNDQAVARNEKQVVITKLRTQNDKLKVELKMLTGKLETFIEKSRQRKHKQMFGVAGHDMSQKDE